MEREDIQKVFNRDFRRLLGVDIFAMADNLEWLSMQKWWNDVFPEVIVNTLKILHANLITVISDFLTYDEVKFPQPLDQYIHIYENKDLIVNVISHNIRVDSPWDDPIRYEIYVDLLKRFQQFFNNILTCGKTHKFDPDLIRRTLERDPDEPN